MEKLTFTDGSRRIMSRSSLN